MQGNAWFEWHLWLASKSAKASRPRLTKEAAVKRHPNPYFQTNLRQPKLGYDHRARLALKDIKPTGFLLKAQV